MRPRPTARSRESMQNARSASWRACFSHGAVSGFPFECFVQPVYVACHPPAVAGYPASAVWLVPPWSKSFSSASYFSWRRKDPGAREYRRRLPYQSRVKTVRSRARNVARARTLGVRKTPRYKWRDHHYSRSHVHKVCPDRIPSKESNCNLQRTSADNMASHHRCPPQALSVLSADPLSCDRSSDHRENDRPDNLDEYGTMRGRLIPSSCPQVVDCSTPTSSVTDENKELYRKDFDVYGTMFGRLSPSCCPQVVDCSTPESSISDRNEESQLEDFDEYGTMFGRLFPRSFSQDPDITTSESSPTEESDDKLPNFEGSSSVFSQSIPSYRSQDQPLATPQSSAADGSEEVKLQDVGEYGTMFGRLIFAARSELQVVEPRTPDHNGFHSIAHGFLLLDEPVQLSDVISSALGDDDLAMT